MKRRAMTLTEILMGVSILIILSGVFSLSPDIYKHTAKREAERIYNKLSNCMLKAARTHISFIVTVEPTRINIIWQKPNTQLGKQTEHFAAKPGCSYKWNGPTGGMTYSHVKNTYTAQTATIKINGKGDSVYYIIVSAVGGRMRLSDTPPSST